MNCNDYLAMLETLPVEELAYGHAREHAAQCRDCDRVTRVVAERERNMRLAFDDVQSFLPSAQVAVHALERSRRQRIARFYQWGLGIAMAASLPLFVVTRRIRPSIARAGVTETFRLQCLSPDQAAEVIRPYISPAGRIWIPPNSLGLITVQTFPQEMQKARSVLDRYDNPSESRCAVGISVPKTP